MKTINLNDGIKVRLTPEGVRIHYEYYNKVNVGCGRQIIKDCFPKSDPDGYTHYQLWDFMNIFGEHITMGAPNVINPLDIIVEERK